jgi:hypothetical protein
LGVEGAEVMEGEEREDMVPDNEETVDGIELTLGDVLEGDFIVVGGNRCWE